MNLFCKIYTPLAQKEEQLLVALSELLSGAEIDSSVIEAEFFDIYIDHMCFQLLDCV